MASNSYRDIKRYLQATKRLEFEKPGYFKLLNHPVVIIPHNTNSLFKDQIPVRKSIIEKYQKNNVWYGVSHSDGEIYVRSTAVLAKEPPQDVTEGNLLYPIDKFINIKKVITNKYLKPIVYLHAHTENSALDSIAKCEDIARRCKQLDFPAIAMTDHGNMSGAIEFYQACKKYGINPIIGQEFYLDDNRHQKGVPDEVKKAFKKDKDGLKAYEKEHRINLRLHLILLAMNNKGLDNLRKLSSIGFLEGFYYRPRIDWEVLEKHSEGLFCSTACAAGIIWGEKDPKHRITNLKRLIKIFGKENLALEVMLHEYVEQPAMNDYIFKLAEKANLPVILSTDSHYVDPDPNHVQQKYMQIGSGFSYGEGENYMKTSIELHECFDKYFRECKYGWSHYLKAIDNTLEISKKFNVEIELGKFKMPKFDLSRAIVPAEQDESMIRYFKRRTLQGFKKLIVGKVPKDRYDEYKERLKYELKTFIDAGYVNYMLIVLDMIDYAKSIGRMVLVRGSAAGSLLCYCLEMTTVDPIERDLLFERFVSPLRAGLVDKSYQSPPDIDCDYPDRAEIIDYVIEKYGEDRVARIRTANRNQVRQAIKSMADVTKFMDFTEANKVTKMIPDSSKDIEEAVKRSDGFGDWYKKDRNKQWIDTFVEPIIGVVGHDSIHAAGIVIAPGPIQDYLPVKHGEKKKENEKSQGETRLIATQYEGDSVEAIGLLKFDILRVRTLAVAKDCLELVRKRHKKRIVLPRLNLNNKKFYKGFKKKDTQGIFQLDTKPTAKLLEHITIDSFEDVSAVISLSRPGTAGPGLDTEYCERRNEKPFEYDHPLLEPILKETLGICIYQEQLMRMVSELGGMTMVEADKFRKMIKKKQLSEMASYREKFVKGAIERGMKSREEALAVWSKIVSWSAYGFSKNHAAAYAQLSIWTMILKQHFPIEFFTAWLENPKNKNQLLQIYRDMRKHDIPIVFPDVNRSKENFYISKDNEIVWSIKGIKYVGDKVASSIAANAPYMDMKDFVRKNKGVSGFSKRSVEPLICIDAFPWCKTPFDAAKEYFDLRGQDVPPQFNVSEPKFWNKQFREYTGFYKMDPFEVYKKELAEFGRIDSIEEFRDFPTNEATRFAGYVMSYRTHVCKNNKGIMAFITIEVDLEPMEIIAWPSFYKKSALKEITSEDQIVGKFALVFGNKATNLAGKDQVQLSSSDEDMFVWL